MKVYTLRRQQSLPITQAQAWEFFSDPKNLALMTPPAYRFRSPAVPLPIFAGQVMVHTVRVLPFIDMTWLTELSHVEAPQMFIDQQHLGPYRFWHHRHLFTPTEQGVEMLDEVHYALPFGPLGQLVHALFVKRQLATLFDFRAEYLRRKFGKDRGAGMLPAGQ